MIDANELLEYAVVYGDYKGIPKTHVRKALASGKDVILRIDVQGAATIRRLIPEAVTIFLVAENEEEQLRRLLERKTESPDRLKMRIATARKEMQHLQNFQYVVVNRDDRQEETVDKVISIIQAEKCRVDWSLAHRSVDPAVRNLFATSTRPDGPPPAPSFYIPLVAPPHQPAP